MRPGRRGAARLRALAPVQTLLNAIAAMDLPVDAQRVFPGRSGACPGCERWMLELDPPVWGLTCFQPAIDAELASIAAALSPGGERLGPGQPMSWVYPCGQEGRRLTLLNSGSVPEPNAVTEDGTRYRARVLRRA